MTPLRLALPAPVTGRIPVLDELKGVAIILVILYHAGGVLGWANTLHGDVGVDMFVILSGIGLTLGPPGEPAGRFLLRRFLRIYPAYWIVLTACLLAGVHFRGDQNPPGDVILHYVGIHAWFGDVHAMSINDSFWFITLIVSLYVIYLPVRGLLGRPDVLLAVGALLSLAFAWFYLRLGSPVGFANLSLRLPGFFLGLLAGRLLRAGALEIPLTPALGVAAFALIYFPNTLGFLFTSVWIGGALMAAYAFGVAPALPPLARGQLAFLGSLSLEIFLLHQPLIREYPIIIMRRLSPGIALTPGLLVFGMACGLTATLVLSIALHRLLRPLGGLFRRPQGAAA